MAHGSIARTLLFRGDERAKAIIIPALSLGLGLLPRSLPNVWTDGERVEIDLIVDHIADPQWRALQRWFARAEYVFTHYDNDDEPLHDRSHANVIPWQVRRALEDGMDELSILVARYGVQVWDERELPF